VSGTDTERSAAAATVPAGVTPPGAAGGRKSFLSDVIVDLGFATRETVEQAVRAARSPGTTVGRVLVTMNAISEEQLARATAERYGIDFVDLDGFRVDPAAAGLIKPAAAQRYQAVPVAFLDEDLLVAMGDPADAVGVNDIAVMTARRVRAAVASRPALESLLKALPLEEREPDEHPEPPPAPADDAEAPELRAELEALKSQLAGAEARLRDAGPPGATEAPDLAGLRAKLAEAEAELDDARARVREAKEVSAELETLREALAAAEAGLNARALEGPSAQRDREAERQAARRHSGQVEAELRRIRADIEVRSGELEALRGRLAETETELVRVRSELGRRVSELQVMRTRAESAEAEATSAMGRVVEAERESDEARREAADAGREAAEARRLAQELEGTDERADGARRALVEMREEHERERERSAMAERDLREALVGEQTRRAELEQRLSEVEGSAFAAERAFDELGVAQDRMRQALRALADPGAREG
jgi:DNA repair exonuclease SbcCD ATPase subunit